jgi:Protein of unknown function (DUF4239)
MTRARVKLIRSPLTSSCLITCLQNMETGLKPREPRYAKQFHRRSIEFGEKGNSTALRSAPFKASAEGEALYQRVQELQPTNDIQRGLKERIIQTTTDLAQARFLLFSHLGSSIPLPFLAVLLLWMIILFAGFSLMAPANATTLASLVICALSVSAAIFLILELDQPFTGLMVIPSEPLRSALTPLEGI